MEPECLLPYSQVPATCPYPKPEQSSPCPPPPNLLPEIHLNPFSHLRLGLWSGLFYSGFPTDTMYKPLLSAIRVTSPTHLILLDLITRITRIYNELEIKPLFMPYASVSFLFLKKRKDPAHQRLCCFMNIRCRRKLKNRGTVNVIFFIFYLHI